MNASSFPALLQRFFTERLVTQQGASPHTVAGYRDTFRLLFRFAKERLGREPSALRLEEFDPAFLEAFLTHLERDRGNRPRTRNHRLSALHAFFRYVALAEPAVSLQCQRILAIPAKRFERGPVEFLTEDEATALVSAPTAGTWIGSGSAVQREPCLAFARGGRGHGRDPAAQAERPALGWQDLRLDRHVRWHEPGGG